MDPQHFTEKSPGRLVRNLEGVLSFIPDLLPPQGDLLGLVQGEATEATFEVGRLVGTLSAHDEFDTRLLLRPLLQREATLSSRIEGTVADEGQLSMFEARPETEVEVPDVREVRNYLAALEWGVDVVKERGISTMLVRQLHQKLMEGVRGGDKSPGRYRDCQVFIGGQGRGISEAKFVPPPHGEVAHLIDNLVEFMAGDRSLPPVVRMAVAHYQFEAIHPFKDGNGRVGRLLIALQLMRDLNLPAPAVHLSPFIERDRRPYYDGLLDVSRKGDWQGWMRYMLRGTVEQSQDVVVRMRRLRELRSDYRSRLGKATGTAIMYQLIDLLFRRPAIDVAMVVKELGISKPPAMKHVKRLVEAQVLREVTGRERGRLYVAEGILRLASGD